jgi:hypothetical protein
MTYEDLFDKMCNGKENMFIHAGAGNGKSFLVNKMQDVVDNILYAAPTGLAAYNINGSTIHSLFNLPPNLIPSPFDSLNHNIDSDKRCILNTADTLLIDEISMLRCDIFDKVNTILKIIRNCNEPFGGMRLIIVGDLFQLCPIKTKEDIPLLQINYPDNTDFNFYDSMAYKELLESKKLHFYELTYNFRQEEDYVFRKILDEVRLGRASGLSLAALNCRMFSEPLDNTIYLAYSNRIVREINSFEMSKLKDKPFISRPFIKLENEKYMDTVRQCPYLIDVPIIKKMRIRFTMNDGLKNGKRFVNGTRGFVKNKIFNKRGFLDYVLVDINGVEYKIAKEARFLYRAVYNKETGKIENMQVASIIQFPFEPCYASTVHRAQGMTLDSAIIDIEHGKYKYPHGLLYVALSRVRRLDDLYLKYPIVPERMEMDKGIIDFYEEIKPCITRVAHEPFCHDFMTPDYTMLPILMARCFGEKAYLSFDDSSIKEYGPYSKLDKYGFPIEE